MVTCNLLTRSSSKVVGFYLLTASGYRHNWDCQTPELTERKFWRTLSGFPLANVLAWPKNLMRILAGQCCLSSLLRKMITLYTILMRIYEYVASRKFYFAYSFAWKCYIISISSVEHSRCQPWVYINWLKYIWDKHRCLSLAMWCTGKIHSILHTIWLEVKIHLGMCKVKTHTAFSEKENNKLLMEETIVIFG